MNAQTSPALAGQVEPPVRPLLLDNETVPTHRCKVCGALWRELGDGTWNLRSDRARSCCDNAPMGAQIEPLTVGQLQPLLAEDLRTRLNMHQSWEADANAKAERLAQHLRAVLEITRTWQPDYATKMDRDTLAYAAAEC